MGIELATPGSAVRHVRISGLGDVIQKDSSYLQLGPPFCLAERNHSCNFSREHYDEQSCNYFVFEFRPVVQEMLFKIFLIYNSGSPFVRWSRTIYAILVDGIMGEHSCEIIFLIWTSGSEGDNL